MTFDQSMLEHLCRLIDTDRIYAEQAIKQAFKTAPWLEASIGPALRQHWSATTVPVVSSPRRKA